MATLGEIKTRIATELVRDDLTGDLAGQLAIHIARAIEYFSDTRFWFNQIVTTFPATGETVAIPANVRKIDALSIPALDLALLPVPLAEQETGSTGVPETFAYDNGDLRLYPAPETSYTLRLVGVKQIDAPADDGSENEWTDEAQDLIVARARMTLCRDQFRDPEGATLAKAAVEEALDRLQHETAKRLSSPLRPRTAQWAASNGRFNTGW